jgi:hypothetical protein
MLEYILNGHRLNSPEAVFIPVAIVNPCGSDDMVNFTMTRHIKFLKAIDQGSSDNTITTIYRENNDFCQCVIKALGNKENLLQLQQNIDLSKKAHGIELVASELDKVNIRYNDEMLSLRLSCGFEMRCEDGNPIWFMMTPLAPLAFIQNMSTLSLWISGIAMKWRFDLDYRVSLMTAMGIPLPEARVELYFFSDVIIQGSVSLSGFNVHDEDWQQKVRDALSEDRLEFRILGVSINFTSIRDTLLALGEFDERWDRGQAIWTFHGS